MELGHRSDVTGRQRIHVERLATLQGHHVPEPLVVASPTIGQVEVAVHRAGQDPEVGNVAQIGVDSGLEDLDQGVGRRVGDHLDLCPAHSHRDGGPVHRRRPNLNDVVAEAVHSDGDSG